MNTAVSNLIEKLDSMTQRINKLIKINTFQYTSCSLSEPINAKKTDFKTENNNTFVPT